MSLSRALTKSASLLAAASVLALAGCTEPTNPHKQEDRDGGADDPDAVGMVAPPHAELELAHRGFDLEPVDPLT